MAVVLTSTGWSRRAEAGEVVRFGRAGPEEGVDLTLSQDRRLHRHAGSIAVGDDGWQLANTGSRLHLLVADLDGAGQDDLPPGAVRPIPWTRTLVAIALGAERVELTVEQVITGSPAADAVVARTGDPTIEPFALDRSTAYFRTLVALCEPRLTDPRAPIPSDAQLAVRLNRSGCEQRHLTSRSIERRLNYLRQTLSLRDTDANGSSLGLERRDGRVQLVELALTTGLVTARDLGLLEAGRPA